MNKQFRLPLILAGCLIIAAGCAPRPNITRPAHQTQAASGEWHWENFTEEEIQGWSESHYPSFFTLLYRWGETGKKTLLDVGAGQGHETIIFAKKGYSVSALDINKFAMDRLAKAAKEQNLPIKTKVGDVRRLPYADKSFDFVYANQIVNLNGCDAVPGIIAELVRVAKDDGQIFFTLNINDTALKDENSLFKKGAGSLSPSKNSCIPSKNKNEAICSSGDKYTTVYCSADQAMLEQLLKPYKVKWTFMAFFLNPGDLSYTDGAHYHILIEKK